MSKRAYSQLYYHFTWATKDRRELVSRDWEESLYGYIHRKCTEYGFHFLAVGGIEDHIHLLVSTGPELAPSDVASRIKGASSHYINHLLLKKSGFQWQNGYGVFSVGKREIDIVVRYIRNQRKHHQAGTTRDDWEKTEVEEDED